MKNQSVLAERLKESRESKGFTQAYVSSILNIEIGTLSGYELGRRRPNPEVLAKLAVLYTVSSDYLLGIESYPKQQTMDEMMNVFKNLTLEEQKEWLSRFVDLIKDKK